MYQSVKLEKGMYHLTGKSFLQALESVDPSEQYQDSPLAGLDANERQLKRFDIRISGPACDRVEKFFSTTESAVLFPEFIRRAIRQGMETSILSDLTASEIRSESTQYVGCELTEQNGNYSITVSQGTSLPVSLINEGNTPLALTKYGRVIRASYEAVRRQRLDSFAVILRGIGVKMANSIVSKAMTALKEGAISTTAKSGNSLEYSDLAKLCGKFTNFDMTTLIASPSVMANIMTMEQMTETTKDISTGKIYLPFGAVLCKSTTLDNNTIIGIDKNFALEMITGTDLIMETDKLIDNQLDLISMSLQVGFRVIMKEAVHVLTI